MKNIDEFKNFTISKTIEEEIEDLCIVLKEEGESISKVKYDSGVSGKWNLLRDLCIDIELVSKFTSFSPDSRTLHNKKFFQGCKRICKYVSSVYEREIDCVIIFDSIVFGDVELVNYMYKISEFENRGDSGFDNNIFYAEDLIDSNNTLFGRWSSFTSMDYSFTISELVDESFPGIYIYSTDSNQEEFVIYEFERPYDKIGDEIKYTINIYYCEKREMLRYFGHLGSRSSSIINLIIKKIIEMAGDKIGPFKRVSRDTLSVDIYDEEVPVKFYEILLNNAIKLFKSDMVILVDKVISTLSEPNEFFEAYDVIPSKDKITFEIDDRKFTINIDNDLNIYIGDKKEENKTSLEELIHDVYLKLTEKDAK